MVERRSSESPGTSRPAEASSSSPATGALRPEEPGVVVGVGGRAGATEALQQLLAHLPADARLSVAVLSLEPGDGVGLAELLARWTPMQVAEAADGIAPSAGHVYVAAPGTLLALEDGAFRITAADPQSAAGAVDRFFRSLASDRGERAVAIVLSGEGDDGARGLRAVKECGGRTFAQPPGTARREEMPRGAVEAGVVDEVLEPARIAAKVLEHAGRVHAARQASAALEEQLSQRLGEIFERVRERTGHDFRSYKEGTLLRRVRRRLSALGVTSAGDYLRVLDDGEGEPAALVQDLLIGVTQFFRDVEPFRVLEQEVLPAVFEARAPDAPIRIWVPGCASGEEVYSIAILVRERIRREGVERPIQLFATDIDREALGEARRGRYPASIADQMTPERLARYFVRARHGYEVTNELRDMCVFSEHSLIRDPPFSQLDLVSCRNVLIYLGAELQRKLIPLFHYALRPSGFLLLGPSEGVAGAPELFEVVDGKNRIFRRAETATRRLLELPIAPPAGRAAAPPVRAAPPEQLPSPTAREKLAASFERMVLEEYAFPCAVVDVRGEMLLVAGPLARLLQLPAGAPSTNLLEAVRGGLRAELRAALQVAARTRGRVVRERVVAEIEDTPRPLRLVVRPMPPTTPVPNLFLVVLQDRLPTDEPTREDAPPLTPPVVDQLEEELRLTRAELKAAVENMEAANEELKSSNEELVSTNEELQSANDELQTSREELQSLNEELETVNAELRQKVEELGRANSDLQNSFASTDIATLFVDGELRLTKFSPAARDLLGLRPADVARPVAELAPQLLGLDLTSECREVLRTLTPLERQVRAPRGDAWFILRVLPYRTVDDRIVGAVVTLVDVSQLKRAEESLRAAEERLRLLVEAVRDYALLMLASDGTVVSWNAGAERLKGFRADEIVGHHVSRFYPEEDVRSGKPARMLALASSTGRAEDEGWRVRKDGTRFWASVLLTAIRDEGGELRGFAKVTRDFTDRKRAEDALRDTAERLRRAQEIAHLGSWELDVEENRLYWSDEVYRIFGLEPQEFGASYQAFLEAVHPDDRAAVDAAYSGSLREGRSRYEIVHRVVRRGTGEVRIVHEKCEHVRDARGKVVRSLGMVHDITERTRAEEALREREERLRLAIDGSAGAEWEIPVEDPETGRFSDALEASTRLNTFIGVPQGALSTAAWLARVHPEDLPRLQASAQAHVEGRSPVHAVEYRIRHEDGSWRWISSTGRVYRDSDGRALRWAGVDWDVTERKRAELAMERSRQGLSRLAEASLSVIARTDLEGMLQAIAEAALALTGARLATCGHGLVGGRLVVGGSARVPGAPPCPPGDMYALARGGVHTALTEGARSIRLTDAQLRAHPRWWGLPDGHVPMRGLLGVRMLGREDRVNGLILVTDKENGDFTAEDESLLEQLATVASLALQHVEARVSLEAADRHKNEFLAMLSHELRNPLAPVRNSLFILERAAPGGEQARRAQAVIERQVTHMTRLVDDLLDVTRISRGKVQLRRERADLGELLRRAVEDHREGMLSNGVAVGAVLPARPVWVHGDPTRLAQILDNLLQNAAKFTSAGDEVTAALEANDELAQAIVRVRDTGAGIAPEMIPRLFVPFMQADRTLDRSKGGLGLGLALVRGLVEMHGGTVSVESAGLGRGAEFTVRLPLAERSAPATELLPVGQATVGAGRRVLIIEDNVDAADSLREVLELRGHAVQVAYSGTSGIERARAFAPEVVLCDIGLPGLDGYGVARRLRAEPGLEPAVLVALTGYAGPEDVARSTEAGFDHHLPKPTSVEELVDLLSRISPPAR